MDVILDLVQTDNWLKYRNWSMEPDANDVIARAAPT
jgi:hypothetical protein